MRVLVDLKSRALKPSRALAPIVRHLCQALTVANRIILRTHEFPRLYLSGVRYRAEPIQWPFERFDNLETCLARGWGDCDDLAAWRCAELLNDGIAADILVRWKTSESGRLYHVLVRLPGGKTEDPSLKLGMRPAA